MEPSGGLEPEHNAAESVSHATATTLAEWNKLVRLRVLEELLRVQAGVEQLALLLEETLGAELLGLLPELGVHVQREEVEEDLGSLRDVVPAQSEVLSSLVRQALWSKVFPAHDLVEDGGEVLQLGDILQSRKAVGADHFVHNSLQLLLDRLVVDQGVHQPLQSRGRRVLKC